MFAQIMDQSISKGNVWKKLYIFLFKERKTNKYWECFFVRNEMPLSSYVIHSYQNFTENLYIWITSVKTRLKDFSP